MDSVFAFMGWSEWSGSPYELFGETTICGRVGSKDEQIPLAFDFAGDFEGLGYHIEHLCIHRLAIGGNE